MPLEHAKPHSPPDPTMPSSFIIPNVRQKTKSQMTQNSQLKGIGGWLLLFCIILTFITPVTILGAIGNTLNFTNALGARFPVYTRLVIIAQIIHFGFFCYSIYAGASLWKTKPGAPAKAQAFLIAYALFALVRVTLPYFGALPPVIRDKLVNIYFQSLFRVFVPAVFWCLYLARSVRVKNTFNEEKPV